MRYFFSIGAVWLQELQWHLISPIALFGMSYLLFMGEQVRVDVFYERFPVALQRVIEVIGGLLLLAMGLYIAWLTLPWVEQSYLRNEASPNPGGLPLRWVLKALIPFGFLLLAMQGLAHALRQRRQLLPPPLSRRRLVDGLRAATRERRRTAVGREINGAARAPRPRRRRSGP